MARSRPSSRRNSYSGRLATPKMQRRGQSRAGSFAFFPILLISVLVYTSWRAEMLTTASDQSSPFVNEEFSSQQAQYEALARYFLRSITPQMLQPQVLRAAYEGNLNNLDEVAYYIQIVDGVVKYKGTYVNGRVTSMLALMKRIVERYDVPDCEFIVILNDGTRPQVPVFGVARHWKSWTRMLPMPLLNERTKEKARSGLASWDSYIQESVVGPSRGISWSQKANQAFFRGSFVMQTWRLGSVNNYGKPTKPSSWRDVNRGRLVTVAQTRPDLFDVGITSSKDPKGVLSQAELASIPTVRPSSFVEWIKRKVIICVGSNQDWTERLRAMLFTNSVVLLHEAETQEWFRPLLVPYRHYVPFNLMMDNLVERAEWTLSAQNSEVVQEIIANANRFAAEHLNEESMMLYFFTILKQYASLQQQSLEMLRPITLGPADEESEKPFKSLDDWNDRASVSNALSEISGTADNEVKNTSALRGEAIPADLHSLDSEDVAVD